MIKLLFFIALSIAVWFAPDLGRAANPTATLSIQVIPAVVPGGNANSLIGCYHCYNFTGGWTASLSRPVEYTIEFSFSLPGDGGNGPATGYCTYPQIDEYTMFAPGSNADWASAASGGYDSAWAQTITDQYIPCHNAVYAIRINNEWDFCVNGPVDFTRGQDCSAAPLPVSTYQPVVRRFIQVIRNTFANAGITDIKIEFDAPITAAQQPYWPGDDVVDLTGFDPYWQTQYLGSDSHAAWLNNLNGNLEPTNAWSVAHNKPMIFPEWCETYNDGYIITQFAAWMASHNVVAHSYWNSNDAIGTSQGFGCIITTDQNGNPMPTKRAAFIAAFGNTSYGGSYWTYKPIPPGNPVW